MIDCGILHPYKWRSSTSPLVMQIIWRKSFLYPSFGSDCWSFCPFVAPAGVDHLLCPEIVDNDEIVLTNAKGIYSGYLAEYVIAAIMHFAKGIPRLMAQQRESNWDKFKVTEIRGKTMGIIGYGNIGLACAKLAKAFGMRVIALRRTPSNSNNDPFVDQVKRILKTTCLLFVSLTVYFMHL